MILSTKMPSVVVHFSHQWWWIYALLSLFNMIFVWCRKARDVAETQLNARKNVEEKMIKAKAAVDEAEMKKDEAKAAVDVANPAMVEAKAAMDEAKAAVDEAKPTDKDTATQVHRAAVLAYEAAVRQLIGNFTTASQSHVTLSMILDDARKELLELSMYLSLPFPSLSFPSTHFHFHFTSNSLRLSMCPFIYS